jgi:hypothetical protein
VLELVAPTPGVPGDGGLSTPEPRPVAVSVDDDATVAQHVREQQGRLLAILKGDELNAAPDPIAQPEGEARQRQIVLPFDPDEQVEIASCM